MVDAFDAMNARLAEHRRRNAVLMAQEILDEDRGISFSITMLSLLWRVADGRTIPTIVESRRIANAYARWVKAGRRADRQARRVG